MVLQCASPLAAWGGCDLYLLALHALESCEDGWERHGHRGREEFLFRKPCPPPHPFTPFASVLVCLRVSNEASEYKVCEVMWGSFLWTKDRPWENMERSFRCKKLPGSDRERRCVEGDSCLPFFPLSSSFVWSNSLGPLGFSFIFLLLLQSAGLQFYQPLFEGEILRVGLYWTLHWWEA